MTRLALLAALGLLTACGSQAVPDPDPAASASASPSVATEARCGAVVLDQGERLDVVAKDELACLDGALQSGRAATLTVTAPTDEGDPIVTAWHLTATGTLDAEVDASRDSFRASGPATTHVSCGRITQLPDPLSCAPSG